MRWIPIVHRDTHTLGVVRLDGDEPIDVHWVGEVDHAVSPESWQSLLSMLVSAHHGTGEGWMIRACREAIGGMGGTVFPEVRVEVQAPEDPEAAKLIARTLEVEASLLERITELSVTYPTVPDLAAAIERILSGYDRAILATALSDEDLPLWCQAVASRWWESQPSLRA